MSMAFQASTSRMARRWLGDRLAYKGTGCRVVTGKPGAVDRNVMPLTYLAALIFYGRR